MKNLGKDIETCLKQILDIDYVRSPIRTKIKSGAVVYRITGSSELVYDDVEHKVYLSQPNPDKNATPLYLRTEIIGGKFQDSTDYPYVSEWEVRLLQRGRERSRKDLETALIKRGHAVTVRVGGSNSLYPASIAVEQLSKTVRPGDTFDAKHLAGELIALGEALAPLQKTMDDISLRLRALGIALTINLNK